MRQDKKINFRWTTTGARNKYDIGQGIKMVWSRKTEWLYTKVHKKNLKATEGRRPIRRHGKIWMEKIGDIVKLKGETMVAADKMITNRNI